MLDPKCDSEISFDLNSLLNRHAKVVDLGTHKLWDHRPPIDSSIIKHQSKTIASNSSKKFERSLQNSNKNLLSEIHSVGSSSHGNNNMIDPPEPSINHFTKDDGLSSVCDYSAVVEVESFDKSMN
jgi:hypothetical protein